MADKRASVAAVIVAGGQGLRARKHDNEPAKQYRMLAGKTVIQRTLDAFSQHPEITTIIVAIGSDDHQYCTHTLEESTKQIHFITGGASRQESVFAGLTALIQHSPDYVLIHDAVRPFVTTDIITRNIKALTSHQAILTAIPIHDTIKKGNAQGQIIETIDRSHTQLAQTPQSFHFSLILSAHQKADSHQKTDFTDDAAIAEWAGMNVHVVEGHRDNIKLTRPEDFNMTEQRLIMETLLARGEARTGIGYDVHALGEGNSVTLCGVEIPHNKSLQGHSDADVALHALTDAILGAIGEGDIGEHFPPSNMQWKGMSSDHFLKDAINRVTLKKGKISHLDVQIIAELPKISPHREAMRQSIATICDLPLHRVGVKATTNEKLGFIGRGEGIAAYAVATIRLPWEDDV